MRTSYAKPGKIFTANASLMEREVGKLATLKHTAIIAGVIAILQPTL